MKKFYDTSSLLADSSDLSNVVISSKTLEELEQIKTSFSKSEDVKFAARQAVRCIKAFSPEVAVVTLEDHLNVSNRGLEPTNDNLIISSAFRYAKDHEITLYSEDFLFCLIAKSYFGLSVSSVDEKPNDIYKGYKVIVGNSDIINDFMQNIDYSKWHINEYLIIVNTDGDKTTEMRFDGEKFVSLKLPPSNYIKAKNSLQRCALDLLMNKDITTVAILGGYGSGKTILSTQMALYNVVEKGLQGKVLGIRECSGEGKEIGFLPGTMNEKTNNFFKPIGQQLKGGEFELESLMQRGVLETNIPFYLKGCTYNDTVMIVDEAEDLTESQIRLIGTRLGENSKVYFAGDYKQSLINKTQNNALIKMCNELRGNQMFGCIMLDEDVRSGTSKMFAELFKKDE